MRMAAGTLSSRDKKEKRKDKTLTSLLLAKVARFKVHHVIKFEGDVALKHFNFFITFVMCNLIRTIKKKKQNGGLALGTLT